MSEPQGIARAGARAGAGGGDATPSSPRALGQADLELAKWVAIVTMTIDHYGKIVDPSLYALTNDIGRVTFPLFAWIIGTRLALQPALGRAYLQRLVLWALVSQPVYVLVGRSWHEPNIFATLALGVAAHVAIRLWQAGSRGHAAVALASIAALSAFVDYGLLGVFALPALAALGARSIGAGAWASGPIGVLSNLGVWTPYIGPGAPWAVLASPIAWASLKVRRPLPRLPRNAFYAYYPLHLLALHALGVSVR